MANPEHLRVIGQGVKAWNDWRTTFSGMPDLSLATLDDKNLDGANFSGTNLGRASFWGSRLRNSNLENAHLYHSHLLRSVLANSNLRGADLLSATLAGTELDGVDLSGANLMGACISGAELVGANLSNCVFGLTVLTALNLSSAKGLETIQHRSPSFLDFQTFGKSGQLPLAFLRGCGVPDSIITYIPSLLGQPIKFYSCFISYSTLDQDFADRLYADLQNKGVRCWFAPHNAQSGKKLHEQIDEAIRVYDRLLLILSPASMNSEWVKTEIAKARKREMQEKRRILFPVRLVSFNLLHDWECFDGDTGKDSAREIREYYVPDFSNWRDHDTYKTEFQRLIRDLKAEEN